MGKVNEAPPSPVELMEAALGKKIESWPRQVIDMLESTHADGKSLTLTIDWRTALQEDK